MTKSKEMRTHKKIMAFLKSQPCIYEFKPNPALKRGIPDIAFIFEGRIHFIEVKDGSKVSDIQATQHTKIIRSGGYVLITDNGNLDRIINFMEVTEKAQKKGINEVIDARKGKPVEIDWFNR